MPGGERVEFDPEEGQRFKLQEAEKTAERLVTAASAPGTPPDLARRYLAEAERIRAAVPGASGQHLRNVETMEDKQVHDTALNTTNNATKVQIAQMRKRGGGKGGGGPSLKDKKAELDIRKKELDIDQEYFEAAEKTGRQLGMANVIKQRAALQDMATAVAGAADNAALASMISGAFAKYAQGQSGVLSDKDMSHFWSKIGGIGVRTEQAMHDAYSGKLGPDKQRIVREAIEELKAASDVREAALGEAMASSVAARTDGKARVPAILQTYTPKYLKQWQAQQANAGDKGSLGAIEAEMEARLKKRGMR
jgi:hypothetical protein